MEENEKELVSEIETISNERLTDEETIKVLEASTKSLQISLDEKILCCVEYEEKNNDLDILLKQEINSRKELEM